MLTFTTKLKDANYKSHWNTLVSFDQWKMMSDWLWPMENVWFYFIFIVWVNFSHKTWKYRFWKSVKYFNMFWQRVYDVRFEYVPWRNGWICFISTVWVHFSHKTDKFRFWKSLKYFNIFYKKYMTSYSNMSHEKMSDFISFPCLGSF